MTIFLLMLFFQKSIQTYYEQTYAKTWFLDRSVGSWLVQVQTTIDRAISKTSQVFVHEHQLLNRWWVEHEDWSDEVTQTVFQKQTSDDQRSLPIHGAVSMVIQPVMIEIPQYTWIKSSQILRMQKTLDNRLGALRASSQRPVYRIMDHLMKKVDLDLLSKVSQMLVLDRGEKVFFAGDSLMEGIAPHAIRELYQTHQVESMSKAKVSTGLSYPGFFDWPKTIQETLDQDPQIKLLVMMVGANDTNPMFDPQSHARHIPFDDPRWISIYRERVKNVYEIAKAHHVQVLWVELPNMRRQQLNKRVQVLNRVFQEEALMAKQHFLTIKSDLGMKGSQFSAYSAGPAPYKTRTDDGIHFSYKAQKLLAHKIIQQIRFLTENPIDLMNPCSIEDCSENTDSVKGSNPTSTPSHKDSK